MSSTAKPLRLEQQQLFIALQLQPGSSRIAWGECQNQRIKLYLQARAHDGEANQQLIQFLSKAFKVAKRQIHFEAGELSRQKLMRIDAPQVIPEVLQELLDEEQRKLLRPAKT